MHINQIINNFFRDSSSATVLSTCTALGERCCICDQTAGTTEMFCKNSKSFRAICEPSFTSNCKIRAEINAAPLSVQSPDSKSEWDQHNNNKQRCPTPIQPPSFPNRSAFQYYFFKILLPDAVTEYVWSCTFTILGMDWPEHQKD